MRQPTVDAVGHLGSTGVPEGERFMAYQFVARCVDCAKEFGILWVIDWNRVGPQTVVTITCPHCGTKFNEHAQDLLAVGPQIQKLAIGRPVRSVEVSFDCSYCHKPGIFVSLLHTDVSWDELSKEEEYVQIAACDNGVCQQRGVLQRLKPARVVLGSLNPA